MSRPHPEPAATSCSALAAQEPLPGTAPHTTLWVGLEQEGPWGRDAIASSHLPKTLAVHAEALASVDRVRVLLLRRPGRHADAPAPDPAAPRTLLLAWTGRTDGSGTPWLRRADVRDVDADRLLASLRRGIGGVLDGTSPPEDAWRPTDGPHVLLCTNGRRDLCCALLGRALLDDVVTHPVPAAAADAGRLWECSHPGGHRFAPTVVDLPSGVILGRASPTDVVDRLTSMPAHAAWRGRSCLPPPAQCAELAALGMDPGTPIAKVSSADDAVWRVRRTDGTEQQIAVHPTHADPRPESCGKAPVPAHGWRAEVPDPAA